jgi:hypothetical protein
LSFKKRTLSLERDSQSVEIPAQGGSPEKAPNVGQKSFFIQGGIPIIHDAATLPPAMKKVDRGDGSLATLFSGPVLSSKATEPRAETG